MYDTYWFEMAERPGSLLDITIRRGDDAPFTEEDAHDAVNRLQFNIAEQAKGKLYCSLEIYQNSDASLRWRGENGPMLNSLRDYIWLRRRIEQAFHGDFSRFSTLPRWIVDANTVFLYVMLRVMQVIDAVFNLDRDSKYRRDQYALGEASTLSCTDGEPHEAEIIPFPKRPGDQ